MLKSGEKNKLSVQTKKKAEQEKIKGSKEIQLDPQRALILLIQSHPDTLSTLGSDPAIIGSEITSASPTDRINPIH